jgi:hypothetical protein
MEMRLLTFVGERRTDACAELLFLSAFPWSSVSNQLRLDLAGHGDEADHSLAVFKNQAGASGGDDGGDEMSIRLRDASVRLRVGKVKMAVPGKISNEK